MENLIAETINILSMNADTLIIAVATGIATALAFIIKHIFSIALSFANKTATALDEKLIQKVKEIFKNKIQKL